MAAVTGPSVTKVVTARMWIGKYVSSIVTASYRRRLISGTSGVPKKYLVSIMMAASAS
jgi:hypothetical protein